MNTIASDFSSAAPPVRVDEILGISDEEFGQRTIPCVMGWGPPSCIRDDLVFAMERGDLQVVRHMLTDPEVTGALTDGGLTDDLARAEIWRLEAEEFERKNGKGSRLDPNHPFNVEVLPLIRINAQKYHELRGAQGVLIDAPFDIG